MHFVVITGWDGTNWIINNPDPAYPSITSYTIDAFHPFTLAGYTNSITVDETTSGFWYNGTLSRTNTTTDFVGYAAGTYYANGVTGASTVAAGWSVTIPVTGNWVLSVWVPSNHAATTAAEYSVATGTTQRTITISQLAYSDQWVPLGTFAVTAGEIPFVILSNGFSQNSSAIAFDAIKWTKA